MPCLISNTYYQLGEQMLLHLRRQQILSPSNPGYLGCEVSTLTTLPACHIFINYNVRGYQRARAGYLLCWVEAY